ncbi:XRE family transcriptional regulator [Marinomonas rhizomae]|uniref:helix-turn-helix domain-containing protein n=1 Tax=Marinomonas rhizomae TaxID=491948 RepID=UPI002102DF2C|nr:XRE family transcriptional regulator [Marinomonas rhizomae]UTW01188.1 XRE family transcriptional regulator [Marinomonas rhizomae]
MEELQYTNIFDAITDDPAESADLEFRADMMLVLKNYFQSKNWTQSDIMAKLEISQPRVSELSRGKVDKFSSDKLIGFLAKIGYTIKPTFKLKDDRTPIFECTTRSLNEV